MALALSKSENEALGGRVQQLGAELEALVGKLGSLDSLGSNRQQEIDELKGRLVENATQMRMSEESHAAEVAKMTTRIDDLVSNHA